MAQQESGFWSSLQGILTGIAAVITAMTGLYLAIEGGDKTEDSSLPPKKPVAEVVQTVPLLPEKDVSSETIVPRSAADKPLIAESAPAKTTLSTAPPATDSSSNSVATLSTLLNCNVFPTVNTVKSLMSWSNYYHQKIIDADNIHARALRPCEKTITYRGQAHCKVPDNIEVRQALFETLSLCRHAGITWEDITQ